MARSVLFVEAPKNHLSLKGPRKPSRGKHCRGGRELYGNGLCQQQTVPAICDHQPDLLCACWWGRTLPAIKAHSLNTGEDESDRLRIENNVLSTVFENRLIFAPLSRPRRILDCGYGTSDWAAQVAAQHPLCAVSCLVPCLMLHCCHGRKLFQPKNPIKYWFRYNTRRFAVRLGWFNGQSVPLNA